MPDYYNYHHHLGDEPGLRRSFISHLWRSYQKDPHWAPPEYQAMRSAVINPHAHIARQQPVFIHSHAIRRPDKGYTDWLKGDSIQIAPVHEETVAPGSILHDPLRSDQAAQRLGWKSIAIGPIDNHSPAAQFLTRQGARPRQTYQHFEWP